MNPVIVESSEGVTLVAGGPVTRRDLAFARARAPRLVAADGGADRALACGHEPEAVIGDDDSLSDTARALLSGRIHRIAEQETTDFDKALRSIKARFVLALGVAGGRLDHEMAVFNALVRHSGAPCLLIGAKDVVFHAPPKLEMRMAVGDRLSLFPMARVSGISEGLRWPIAGLDFAPDGRIGTSNAVVAPIVRLEMGPGMLVMVPRRRLDAVLRGLL